MQELDEETVRLTWLQLSGWDPAQTLSGLTDFQKEQPEVFRWLTTTDAPEPVQEMLLQLGWMIWEIVRRRNGFRQKLKLPVVEAGALARVATQRQGTVGTYLAGQQAQSLPMSDAFEAAAQKFDLPQFALLGHAVEALLEEEEAGEATRRDLEKAFLHIVVLIETVHRRVK